MIQRIQSIYMLLAVILCGLTYFFPLSLVVVEDGIALTQAKHAARVKIDEDGCEAAAYTVLAPTETAIMLPEEEIDFTLDEPFVFAITGIDGLPLFVGLVNQPD